MKQQDLDPSSLRSSAAYSEPSNDLKPLRSSLNFCSNIHVHRSFRYEDGSYDHPWYLKQMRAVWVSLGQIRPMGTGIYLAKHCLFLSRMKQKACPLHIMIYSWEISWIRFSFHRIALNFLSHGPYEHLNPGFPGNSHLLSVTGIHMALMGKRKSVLSPCNWAEQQCIKQKCPFAFTWNAKSEWTLLDGRAKADQSVIVHSSQLVFAFT